MSTHHEAIIKAFKELGGERTIREICDWVRGKYGDKWKDFGIRMADMVPQEMGGNPTSTVKEEFRILRRVSRGKYSLIVEKLPKEKHQKVRKQFTSSNHSEKASQVSSQTDRFVIMPRSDSVRVWSTERLPFEPKGWLKRLRNDICVAVRRIHCEPRQLLQATYWSLIEGRCDTENILFYNVGTNCFAQVSRTGIRFERVFSQPPATPGAIDIPMLHFHHYKPVDKEDGFEHWMPTKTLARWSARIPTRPTAKLPSLTHIWHWMKCGSIELISRPYQVPKQFGLSMTIRAPSSSFSNLAALLKPLLDGAVVNFHKHDGTMQVEVATRLARILAVPRKSVISHLNDGTNAVLGKRRLLWPWGNCVQWNPADDCCVMAELVLTNSSRKSLNFSGRLLKVRETGRARERKE